MSILRSTDAGAPALTGLAGSLIAVLDFCLVAGSGWTKPFSGTNLAVYQMPAGSTGRFLRVDDSSGTNARLRLYESMTDVNTGVGPCPTEAQVSGGLYLYKSSLASSVARPWTFAGFGAIFHFFPLSAGTANDAGGYTCGDIKPYRSGDQYHTLMIGNIALNAVASNNGMTRIELTMANTVPGHFLLRPYLQIGSSTPASKGPESVAIANYLAGIMPFPCPIDGGIHIKPISIIEPNVGRRGSLPGLWAFEHPVASLTHLDTFSGTPGTELAGKSFEYHRIGGAYVVCIEVSDTWDL